MGKQKNPLKPLEYQPFNPHKAFEMLRKDTDTIVIFIHGFLGSPHQFISLADFVCRFVTSGTWRYSEGFCT